MFGMLNGHLRTGIRVFAAKLRVRDIYIRRLDTNPVLIQLTLTNRRENSKFLHGPEKNSEFNRGMLINPSHPTLQYT